MKTWSLIHWLVEVQWKVGSLIGSVICINYFLTPPTFAFVSISYLLTPPSFAHASISYSLTPPSFTSINISYSLTPPSFALISINYFLTPPSFALSSLPKLQFLLSPAFCTYQCFFSLPWLGHWLWRYKLPGGHYWLQRVVLPEWWHLSWAGRRL